jgi:uncharacterized protein (DUF2141 family)
MKNITLTTLLLFITITAFSQSATTYFSPAASPQATVSQNVGMTKISINYSSPGVKGREIFGELVPYDQIWRAGANSPTKIKFSTSVKIGYKTLRAGEYSIAITPRLEGEWTIDFNSAGKYPFAYMTDGKIDMEAYNADLAHSITTEVATWDSSIERLTYFIDANDNKKANVNMLWDNVIVPFEVDTMPEEHLKKFASIKYVNLSMLESQVATSVVMLCARSALYASISIFPSFLYENGYLPALLKSIVQFPFSLGIMAIAYFPALNVLSPILISVENSIIVGLFAPALHNSS